jgi:hypothetical protein
MSRFRLEWSLRSQLQCVLLILLATAIAVVLVAPSYDLLPTTLRDTSRPHIFFPAALEPNLRHFVMVVSAAPLFADAGTLSCELLSLTCTRLC